MPISDSVSLSQYQTGYGASVGPHAEDLCFKKPRSALGQCSPVFSAYQGSSPEVKQMESKAGHAPPYIAKDKNEWSYLPALPYALSGCV